jgi:predicted RNA-binding Zn ribbon-like protein
MSTTGEGPAFEFIGGQIALDFVNTVDWEDGNELKSERLNGYDDLVAWARAARVIYGQEPAHLLEEASRRPAKAAAALAEAIVLRRVLRDIFSRLAAGKRPSRASIDSLNTQLQEAFSHLYLDLTAKEMTWNCEREKNDLRQMLWPVTWAASTLLTSEGLGRLRECEGSSCGWLFLDQSRNGSRRWCDMKVCGNRVKAARFYANSK